MRNLKEILEGLFDNDTDSKISVNPFTTCLRKLKSNKEAEYKLPNLSKLLKFVDDSKLIEMGFKEISFDELISNPNGWCLVTYELTGIKCINIFKLTGRYGRARNIWCKRFLMYTNIDEIYVSKGTEWIKDQVWEFPISDWEALDQLYKKLS